MHLGYNNNKYKYHLHTFHIKVFNYKKILGVNIDEKLSFNDHIYNYVKKASNVCDMFITNLYNADNVHTFT